MRSVEFGSENDRNLAELVEQLSQRLASGDSQSVEDFLAEHVAEAEQLRALIPTLGMLVEVGASAAANGSAAGPSSSGGPPALGNLTVLGDYRVVRHVGQGGMGVVYEAEQMSLRRRVALKVLPSAAMLDPRALQRFHIEAQAAAALHHGQIVPIYGVGCEQGVHYYAMQYIDGLTLADVIRRLRVARADAGDGLGFGEPTRGPSAAWDASTSGHASVATAAETDVLAALSTETPRTSAVWYRRIAALFALAADGLHHAHEMGVTHRDIKPANLMLDRLGHIWITDFGLARVEGASSLTLTGDLLGTLRYMSPEQALAQRIGVDHRTDIYSLGVTLYELLTLRPAFEGEGRQELLRQIAFDEPILPRRHNTSIPRDLETIVLKAIQKNPADRYATSADLAADLRRFVDDRHIVARRPSLSVRLRRFSRRHRAAVAASGVVLLLIAVATVGWSYDHSRRLAHATTVVREALQEAAMRRVAAETKGDDLVAWEQAAASSERAAALANSGPVPSDLVEFAVQQNVAMRRERNLAVAKAEAAAKDVRMLAELRAARMAAATAIDVERRSFNDKRSAEEYANAFANYGIDLVTLQPEEAARKIKDSAIRDELRTALVLWSRINTLDKSGLTARAKIVELSDADSSVPTWQATLLKALATQGRAEVLAVVNALADQATPSMTADEANALAEVANSLGDECGWMLLRKAVQIHPDDFFLNVNVGGILTKRRRHFEALRFHAAAVAIAPQSPGAWSNLGTSLRLVRSNDDDAIEAFRTAIRLQPSLVEARVGLSRILLMRGMVDEAHAEVQAAVRIQPDDAAAYSMLGSVLSDLGRLNEADAAYREAIRLKPSFIEAYGEYVNFLGQRGNYDKALGLSRRAIELDAANPIGHIGLGATLHMQRDLRNAEAAFREAIRLDPGLVNAYSGLALVLCDQGRIPEGFLASSEAIRIDSTHPQAQLSLGEALASQGNHKEAEAAFREALRLAPRYIRAWNSLGSLLVSLPGRTDEAVAAFREAIRIDPNSPVLYRNLALSLGKLGDSEGAVSTYRELLRLTPDDANAHAYVALELHKQQQPDEAIAEYREAIRLQPEVAGFHADLAGPLFALGDHAGALRELQRAVELQPELAAAHAGIGKVLDAMGDRKGAIAALREATRLDPANPTTRRELGDALQEEGQHVAAETEYRVAIQLAPHDSYAHLNLGVALFRQDRLEESLVALREAIRLDPTNTTAQRNLKQIEKQARLHRAYEQVVAEAGSTVAGVELVDVALYALQQKHAPAVALQLYRNAFVADPKLPDRVVGHRQCAASAALQVAMQDHPGESADHVAARSALIRQAVGWLRDDLAAWREGSRGFKKSADVEKAVFGLEVWRQDSDFALIRDDKFLMQLGDDDQQLCRELWKYHAEVVQDLRSRVPPKAPQGAPAKNGK